MKVKELIEKLEQFDQDMEVGGQDYFGDILEIYGVSINTDRSLAEKFVLLSIQPIGPEPD